MTFAKRLKLTAIVTIAIWALLLWNHFNGGVPSHHILAREDLPEISNWWGGLSLPILTWFLLYRIQKRLIPGHDGRSTVPKNIIYGFLGGLFFGTLLAVSFSIGHSSIPDYLIKSVFLLALFFPIYRAEYLLGFVLSMTYTFGGVLPVAIGSIIVLVGAVLYKFVRTVIVYLFSKMIKV